MEHTRSVIDAQFDRAVEIVQSLPKAGPINTDYAEKLQMYSLYKQATVGNVKSMRPGLFDMLGRAKWDSWAKHKDIGPEEAKWLYIEALMKVLSKYSSQTIARELLQELQSYSEDPSNLVVSGTLSRSRNSDSSGSTASRERAYASRQALQRATDDPDTTSDEDDTDEDEACDLPASLQHQDFHQQYAVRPQSSMSASRYRTPTAGSLAFSPPPSMSMSVPTVQPHPGFETPSAFADPYNAAGPTGSYLGQSNMSPPPPSVGSWQRDQQQQQQRPMYQNPPQGFSSSSSYGGQGLYQGRPSSRVNLERAVENVQGHLAALQERIDRVEARRSNTSLPVSPPRRTSGSGSSSGEDRVQWDLDDLGMWSFILNPVSRGISVLGRLATFFAHDEHRSPALVVVRRLCLDISFLVFVFSAMRTIWRKSGVRRQEVNYALVVLWKAVIGGRQERTMMDRGV